MSGPIKEFHNGIGDIQHNLLSYEQTVLSARSKYDQGTAKLHQVVDLLTQAGEIMETVHEDFSKAGEMVISSKNTHLAKVKEVAEAIGLNALNHASAKALTTGIAYLDESAEIIADLYNTEALDRHRSSVAYAIGFADREVTSSQDPEGGRNLSPAYDEIGQIVTNCIDAAGNIEI